MGGEFIIRTKKFMANPLLCRKQFVVEVLHPDVVLPSKKEITQKLVTMYKVKDPQCVFVFQFKTAFGGGRSLGFGLIYDDIAAVKKFEPRHRLKRIGLGARVRPNRRTRKELKFKLLKTRGKEKSKLRNKK